MKKIQKKLIILCLGGKSKIYNNLFKKRPIKKDYKEIAVTGQVKHKFKNLKFDSEIAVVLLSRSFNVFFVTRLTCTPDILLITTAVIKPERPSPTMHIRCLFILKILTLS